MIEVTNLADKYMESVVADSTYFEVKKREIFGII